MKLSKEEKEEYYKKIHSAEHQNTKQRRKVSFLMGGSTGAAMAGIKNPVVVLHRFFDSGLNAEEQDSVIGHELAHLAAGHARKRNVIRATKEFAVFSTVFFTVGQVWNYVQQVPDAGTGLLTAFAVAAAVVVGTHIVAKQYRRRAEFQADRITLDLSSPGVFKSALQKIWSYHPPDETQMMKEVRELSARFGLQAVLDERFRRIDAIARQRGLDAPAQV